jgi:hypothetical protein
MTSGAQDWKYLLYKSTQLPSWRLGIDMARAHTVSGKIAVITTQVKLHDEWDPRLEISVVEVYPTVFLAPGR